MNPMNRVTGDGRGVRCLRDLVHLLNPATLNMAEESGQVIESWANLLLNILKVNIVCIVLKDLPRSPDIVAVCTTNRTDGAQYTRTIAEALLLHLSSTGTTSPLFIPNPAGAGALQVRLAPIGPDGRQGAIAICSSQSYFPSEIDRLLLDFMATRIASLLPQLNGSHRTNGVRPAKRPRHGISPVEQPYGLNPVLSLATAKLAGGRSLPEANGVGGPLAGVNGDQPIDSQLLLKSLLDHAPIGIAFFDQAQRYVCLNQTLAEINGLPVEAHLRRPIQEVLPVTAKIVGPIIDQVFKTGQPVKALEITGGEAPAAPGALRRWLADFYPVIRDNQTLYVGVTLTEVTHRQQTEAALQKSVSILQAVIEGVTDGIFVKDREGRYLIINSAGAQSVDRKPEEFVGRSDRELLPPDLAEAVQRDDRRVMESGRPHLFENELSSNGVDQFYHTLKAPYVDDEGNVIGTIGIARNMTEIKQAEAADRLLAKAGEVLASSLDYSTRLANVAHLVVPHLADWCAVDMLEEDGTIRRVAAAHPDSDRVQLAYQLWERYPPDPDATAGVPHVLRTGQAEFYPDVTAELLEAAAHDAEHLQMLRDLRMKSAMMIPLTARGHTLGAMTFIWAESDRRYSQADLKLAEELGRRAGLAVDNARLYKAEQEARRSAEWIARHASSLQTVTAALSEALMPEEVVAVILEQGIDVLSADGGVVALINESGSDLKILNALGYPPESVEAWRTFPLSAPVPLAETARTGRPIFIDSFQALRSCYPELAAQYRTNNQGYVALPLIIESRIIGVIGLSFAQPPTFNRRDKGFMIALARQCAQALERARLYEAEKAARAEAEAAQQRLAILAETKERNRLAQELHDTVAQSLGYLNMKLGAANMLLSEGRTEEIEGILHELKEIVGETYTDVREEIFHLRAKESAGVGFLELLRRYVDKYKRFYNLDIQLLLAADEAAFELPTNVTHQVVRTIQEALINIRKHAQVPEATLRLDRQAGEVHIWIEDGGRGFEIDQVFGQKEDSFGLSIMQERIRSIGGRIEIDSTPGEGSQIALKIPLGREQAGPSSAE